MNSGYRNIIFFFICFFLIFNNVPKAIQMNFIGGPVGNKLVLYPLLVGFVYTVWCQWHCGGVFARIGCFGKYCAIYLGTALVSLLLGLYTYPYWDLVLAGPVDQIEKLPKMMALLHSYGIEADSRVLMSIWIVVRQIKGLLLEMFWCLGGAYMVYCWYKDDWKAAFGVLSKAILCSIAVLCGYSLVEVFYFADNTFAKEILSAVTPYFHEVKKDGTWWPPLLWNNQLRSVFAEPSYFGIYSAFCLPFLWLMIFKSDFNSKRVYGYILTTVVITFFLILTKARTGFMLHLGEIAVLGMLLFYLRNKCYWKRGYVIVMCSLLAFVGGNLFISNYMNPSGKIDQSVQDSMNEYIDSNMASLANPDTRSNRARYSVMEANVKVGLEYPILGVGKGLRNAYVIDAFSERALKNNEVKMWLSFADKLGILRFNIPGLGEYTTRFCETGILGLLVFLLPAFCVCIRMLRRLKVVAEDVRLYYVVLLTSIIGVLVSGIGDVINITYSYWILLGLGYAMCLGSEESVDDVNDERA